MLLFNRLDHTPTKTIAVSFYSLSHSCDRASDDFLLELLLLFPQDFCVQKTRLLNMQL